MTFMRESEVVPIPPRKQRVLLELFFKGTCAKPFKLQGVEDQNTVRDLKALCEAKCSLPPEQQRLLYKGALLQDTQTLEEARIPHNATLFLVKGASAATPAKTEPTKQPKREEVREDSFDREAMMPEVWAFPCIECGVNPGRPQTDGLCSYCFRELVLAENALLRARKEEARRQEVEAARLEAERKKEEEEKAARRQKNTTRCYLCNKKTGLTGFLCRCGYVFCATHRHAEDHVCTFDHKAQARQLLAEQNPKLDRTGLERIS